MCLRATRDGTLIDAKVGDNSANPLIRAPRRTAVQLLHHSSAYLTPQRVSNGDLRLQTLVHTDVRSDCCLKPFTKIDISPEAANEKDSLDPCPRRSYLVIDELNDLTDDRLKNPFDILL